MVVTNGAGYLERPRSSGLAEVIDIILDKGLVIDAFVRVSLLGLELLTIDARIVVASVDTYLRYAEAVDRLVLEPASTTGVADLATGLQHNGAKSKVSGALEGAKESAKDTLGLDEDEAEQGDEEPRRERRPARKKTRSRS